jgi:hypothetical protein
VLSDNSINAIDSNMFEFCLVGGLQNICHVVRLFFSTPLKITRQRLLKLTDGRQQAWRFISSLHAPAEKMLGSQLLKCRTFIMSVFQLTFPVMASLRLPIFLFIFFLAAL